MVRLLSSKERRTAKTLASDGAPIERAVLGLTVQPDGSIGAITDSIGPFAADGRPTAQGTLVSAARPDDSKVRQFLPRSAAMI
jgi:hypothetical protein